MLNLNNLFVSETCSKSCAIDSRTSFLALAITVKKIQKLLVKLAQSGCKLVPSVNLGVLPFNLCLKFDEKWTKANKKMPKLVSLIGYVCQRLLSLIHWTTQEVRALVFSRFLKTIFYWIFLTVSPERGTLIYFELHWKWTEAISGLAHRYLNKTYFSF